MCAGKKARREAEKLLRQSSEQDDDVPTLGSVHSHSRRLLTTNSSNSTVFSDAQMVGAVKGTLSFRFDTTNGGGYGGGGSTGFPPDWCYTEPNEDNAPDPVYTIVRGWILKLINDDATVDPEGKDPYAETAITVARVGIPEQPQNGEQMCENHGYDEQTCNSIGCCHFDAYDQGCWSDVGTGPCVDTASCDATLEISVTLVEADHRNKVVELLSNDLLSNPANCGDYGMSMACTQFPGDVDHTQAHSSWDVLPYVVYCGDGILQADTEHCDEGAEMSDFSSCNQCRCNSNGYEYDASTGKCVCTTSQPNPLVDAVETSSVQGAENNLVFAVQLSAGVAGARLSRVGQPKLPSPVIVTISGLQGATPAESEPGVVSIACQHAMPDALRSPLGSKWERIVDDALPTNSTFEFNNPTLAEALARGQMAFTTEELDTFQISDLSCSSYIKLCRLKWERIDEADLPNGTEVHNPTLAAALAGKTEFTKTELDAFQVSNLSCSSYINVSNMYYKPAGDYYKPSVDAWSNCHASNGCGLGLAQRVQQGNDTDWRYGFAEWDQSAGELKFVVLEALDGSGSSEMRTFHLSFTVTNADSVQDRRRPEVSVCAQRAANTGSSYTNLGLYDAENVRGNNPLSDTGYILGATCRRRDSSSDPLALEFRKDVRVDGVTANRAVLRVTVPGGSMPPNSELILCGEESEVDKGLVRGMDRRIPFKENGDIESVLAGKGNTMVELRLQDKDTKDKVSLQSGEIALEIAVDTPQVRVRGGCYTPESNIVTVCLGGYVGLYKYDDSGRQSGSGGTGWVFVSDDRQVDLQAPLPAHNSRTYTKLTSKLLGDVSASYAVFTTPPCNDYKGSGRAGGDKVCLDDAQGKAKAFLGGGTISKMPSIDKTSRPAVDSQSAMDVYLNSMAGEDVKYLPRKSWQKVDLTRWNKVLPARFGHATATVSGSRVLIYGGIGCASMDVQNASSSGFCLQGTVLNDLWEFDLLKWSKSGSPLELLNLSPVLDGLAGPSMIVLPGEDHRVLTFGGASILYPLMELMKSKQERTDGRFEYRELEFRASKVTSKSLDTFSSISSGSVASNATHIMLVAGYLGNTRTQAVHTYEVEGSSPELALKSMLIQATGPDARSKPGLIKPDGTTLLMYGGIVKGNVGGVKTQAALGDLWEFDLNTQAWSRVHDTLTNEDFTPRAFGAFGSFESDGETFVFTFGGLLKGFHSVDTFRGALPDGLYQVSDKGMVYMASFRNSKDPWIKESWSEVRAKRNFDGMECSQACRTHEKSCPERDRGVGCKPQARAFQTMDPGHFVAGRQSMIMFGGLDREGMALGDLWYMDVDATEYLDLKYIVPWYEFRSNEWCKPSASSKCLRALCQSRTGPAKPAAGDATRRSYCYDDTVGDGDNTYRYDRQCEAVGDSTYECAAPGKRHGHSSVPVRIEGDTTMLLIVGGERDDWGENSESLTMDVHIAYFTAAFGTWAKVYTIDKNGVECPSGAWGSIEYKWCPQPRRDAAVKMMGNDASSNGRLLMFGGLAAGEGMTQSVGRAYLKGLSQANVVGLNDLWYLDLAPIAIECVSGAKACTPLQWIKIDVPGEKPAGRWGPGMVLDLSDNLYIIGGSTFDSASQQFKVLNDIYIFQLRDPYYKYCSATGSGLQAAVAGRKTPFYLQCRDAFGEPSASASFAVDIVGQEQQPTMKPAPRPDPNEKGLYSCTFTPFVTGQYEVRIAVGRGGSDYMDLIEGLDLEPGNNEHEFTFMAGGTGQVIERSQKVFLLSVEPGDTNAQASEAVGDYMTRSTAGAIGSFLVTAKDTFDNRRPGGDAITSLMRLWNEFQDQAFSESAMPETGSVLDQKDGSYEVTYRITKAGMYRHQVSLVGTVGGGTPVYLFVSSDVADVSRTYVYGELRKLETGTASTVFVQTRDKYGNHRRPESPYDPLNPCVG